MELDGRQSSALTSVDQRFEQVDPLDELYDQMLLSERFSDEFDHQEVWR
jgi:hypothetical protein